jgi:hypothetical protein
MFPPVDKNKKSKNIERIKRKLGCFLGDHLPIAINKKN